MFRPGWRLLEVDRVDPDKLSKKGERYWKVSYKTAGGSPIVDDVFMQEGKGAWFTAQRFLALGFQKGDDVQPHELVGRRVWAYLYQKTEEWSGKEITKTAIDSNPKDDNGKKIDGHFAGLFPESWSPPTPVIPDPLPLDDSAPF